MDIPKQINPRWLEQSKTRRDVTRKTLDNGEPNPNYVQLSEEIAAAEVERKRWDQFQAWVKTTLEALLNQYPVRKDGQEYAPGTVFLKKDKTTGKTTVWTRAQAWEQYQTANP